MLRKLYLQRYSNDARLECWQVRNDTKKRECNVLIVTLASLVQETGYLVEYIPPQM